jgi:hypothetical protein
MRFPSGVRQSLLVRHTASSPQHGLSSRLGSQGKSFSASRPLGKKHCFAAEPREKSGMRWTRILIFTSFTPAARSAIPVESETERCEERHEEDDRRYDLSPGIRASIA